MPAAHSLFEIRTSREGEHTPEAAVQLFASLPILENTILPKLLKNDERLSFEIWSLNQTIYFLCYCPDRLKDYLQSLVIASYPEALTSPVSYDLMMGIAASPSLEPQSQTPVFTATARLKLKHQDYLPLKTFRELNEIDTLGALLSTLSSSQPMDQVVVQFLLADDGDRWKGSGYRRITNSTASTSPDPQKSLIEQKLSQRSLKVAINLAVQTTNAHRTHLVCDSIAAAFQSSTLSDGNQLLLKRPILGKTRLVKEMAARHFTLGSSQHLTLDELATLYHFPNKKLSGIPNIAWGKRLFSEPPENLPIVTKAMDPAVKKNINPFAQTFYKNAHVTYGIQRTDRRRHMYVIGKTGTGKSTLLANMAINDLKNDEGLCVIDPHGDLVETLLDYIPSHRINDVVYFDPSDPERTVKINLFEGENVVHRELIASGIVSVFQKLYAYSWGPRLEYILRNALLTLLKSEQARMSDILDLLTNEKFRAKIVEPLDDPILKNFWVHEFDKMQDKLRTEAIAPILNKVGQFVSSPLVRDVVNAHKSSFSIEDIMNEGKILLVNLSQGRLGEDNATLLGAMLITKIQLSAMGRVHIPEAERRDFYMYVDEFQNFATQSFNKILSEARKYRLNLILANQYIAQIPEDVQKAIFGNCGSMVSFVMGADDAGVFSKEFSQKYTQEDLVTLGKYQVVNKLSIDNIVSMPFTATTLPLAKSRNQNRDKVIRVSRERYATKKGWVKQKLDQKASLIPFFYQQK